MLKGAVIGFLCIIGKDIFKIFRTIGPFFFYRHGRRSILQIPSATKHLSKLLRCVKVWKGVIGNGAMKCLKCRIAMLKSAFYLFWKP